MLLHVKILPYALFLATCETLACSLTRASISFSMRCQVFSVRSLIPYGVNAFGYCARAERSSLVSSTRMFSSLMTKHSKVGANWWSSMQFHTLI